MRNLHAFLALLLSCGSAVAQVGPIPYREKDAVGGVASRAFTAALTPHQRLDLIPGLCDIKPGCIWAGGVVRLSAGYTGAAGLMRVKVSGAYVAKVIPFKGAYIDTTVADTFAVTRDVGTQPEFAVYDQIGGNNAAFPAASGAVGPWLSMGESSINGLRTLVWDAIGGGNGTVPLGNQGFAVSGLSVNEDNFSLGMLGRSASRYPAYASDLAELNAGTGNNTRYEMFSWNWINPPPSCASANGGLSVVIEGGGNGFSAACASSMPITAGLTIISSGATSVDFRSHGEVYTGAKVTTGVTATQALFGYSTSTGATHATHQDALGFAIWGSTTTAAEYARLSKGADRIVGYRSPTDTLTLLSDSTGDGTGLDSNNTFFRDLTEHLDNKYEVYVMATSGDTATSKLASIGLATAKIRPGANNVAIVSLGYNDLNVLGKTPAQAVAAVTGICDAWHAAGGGRIIAVPAQKVGNPSGAASATAQNALWTLLAAQVGHCDGVAANWTDPTIGNSGAGLAGTYYYSDSTHLTAAGERLVESYVYDALSALDIQ